MDDMTVEQAFAELGIPQDADEEAITAAYHTRTRDLHPDVADGSNAEQARLNRAAEIAREHAKLTRSLVPVATAVMQPLYAQLVRQEAASRADGIQRAVVARRTRPFVQMRLISLLMTATTGAFTLVNKEILPTLSTSAATTRMATLMTVAMGLMAGVGHLLVEMTKTRVEAYSDRLRDKRFCGRELARIVRKEVGSTVSEEEITGEASSGGQRSSSSADVVSVLSPGFRSETRPLLLSRAVEHGFLVPIEGTSSSPLEAATYKLTIDLRPLQPEWHERTP